MDFENEGGETYICGNPPYAGSTWQTKSQKEDVNQIFDGRTRTWKTLDYVASWFVKAVDYGNVTTTKSAFVATNSICQGQQVPILWPLILKNNHKILFAHTSFKWANLASHNAGVTVVIVGIGNDFSNSRKLFSVEDCSSTVKVVANINPYLVPGDDIVVEKSTRPPSSRVPMDAGSKPVDGGNLFMDFGERTKLLRESPEAADFIRDFSSSHEFINGNQKYCIWIEDSEVERASGIPEISRRLAAVVEMRESSTKANTRQIAETPHRFGQPRHKESSHSLIVPRVSSENRPFLPVGIANGRTIVGDRQFAMYDAELFNVALIASRLHWMWIGTVCVRMRTDFSYSNVLGWNTFPVPKLTEQNKIDLQHSAEEILIARESHFPATIADLYDPEQMPDNLREAHDRNDETLERIYIGRRFKNDTERLEKLFEMYTKMTAKAEE